MNCNTATRPTTGSASAATGRLRPLFLRGSVPRGFATPFFKGPGALQRRPGFISPHYGNLGCVRRLVQHKEARDTGAFSREEGSHGRHHDVGPRRLARRKQIQDHIDAAAPQSVRASPLPPRTTPPDHFPPLPCQCFARRLPLAGSPPVYAAFFSSLFGKAARTQAPQARLWVWVFCGREAGMYPWLPAARQMVDPVPREVPIAARGPGTRRPPYPHPQLRRREAGFPSLATDTPTRRRQGGRRRASNRVRHPLCHLGLADTPRAQPRGPRRRCSC